MQGTVKPKRKRIVRIQVAEMVTRPSGTGTQVKPGTYAAGGPEWERRRKRERRNAEQQAEALRSQAERMRAKATKAKAKTKAAKDAPAIVKPADELTTVTVNGLPAGSILSNKGNFLSLKLAKVPAGTSFKVSFAHGAINAGDVLRKVTSKVAAAADLRAFTKGGPAHWAQEVVTEGVLGETDQAKQIAAANKIDASKETISFCNTGHWAATNWFAMSEVLGQKNVKLYAASMVEWSQDANLPMANAPTRAQQLMQDAKGWVNKVLN